MKTKNILVLGSKPNSKLPNVKINKVYSANGAAERAAIYKINNKKLKLTCVVGALSFNRDFRVRRRIIKSNPYRLIIRCGQISLPKELKNKVLIKYYNQKNQWNFQKNFFKYKSLTLFIAELFYNINFFKKIRYFYKSLKNNSFQGMSTGFYSILLALKENPNCDVIVTGIGMNGGGHFYKNSRNARFNYDARSGVDRFLIKRLDKKLKKRIFSTDPDFVKFGEINEWKERIV